MHIAPHSFLDAMAKRWDEALASLAPHSVTSRKVVDTGLGTMGIESGTPLHVALIQVWEWAQCFDANEDPTFDFVCAWKSG